LVAEILLIDDEPQVLHLLKMMLEREGHNVTTAENGEEGLKNLRTGSYELVDTDLFMDGQDGLSTIMEMRRDNRNMPIIAISGGGWTASGADYLDVARKMGVDCTFTKPISHKKFIETVQQLLTDKEAEQGQ